MQHDSQRGQTKTDLLESYTCLLVSKMLYTAEKVLVIFEVEKCCLFGGDAEAVCLPAAPGPLWYHGALGHLGFGCFVFLLVFGTGFRRNRSVVICSVKLQKRRWWGMCVPLGGEIFRTRGSLGEFPVYYIAVFKTCRKVKKSSWRQSRKSCVLLEGVKM